MKEVLCTKEHIIAGFQVQRKFIILSSLFKEDWSIIFMRTADLLSSDGPTALQTVTQYLHTTAIK